MRFHGAAGTLLVACFCVLAGCHARAPQVSTAPPPSSAPPAPPSPPPPSAVAAVRATPAPLSEDEQFRRKSIAELNAEHPLSDALFDFDSVELRDQSTAKLQRDAEWLRRWPSTAVVIQGQCDDRGSSEYNLALGEKRARVVDNYLTTLGVGASRLSAVSLGKESPVCRESTDACRAENRRGHLLITGK
jgi:peptidoglycan-associated lipoprotein